MLECSSHHESQTSFCLLNDMSMYFHSVRHQKEYMNLHAAHICTRWVLLPIEHLWTYSLYLMQPRGCTWHQWYRYALYVNRTTLLIHSNWLQSLCSTVGISCDGQQAGNCLVMHDHLTPHHLALRQGTWSLLHAVLAADFYCMQRILWTCTRLACKRQAWAAYKLTVLSMPAANLIFVATPLSLIMNLLMGDGSMDCILKISRCTVPNLCTIGVHHLLYVILSGFKYRSGSVTHR